MCLCTPNIRTPWCGKKGCERPPNCPLCHFEVENGHGATCPKQTSDDIYGLNERVTNLEQKLEKIKAILNENN